MQPTTTLSPRGRQLPTTETERLRRLLAAKGLRGPDIDDALQEVNVRMLRRAPSEDHLAAWATRVAINVAMDHHRRRRRARRLDEQLGSVSSTTACDPDIAERVMIAVALAELAPEHRAVVKLHLLADLTVPETARRLAVPEGTVKSRLHRALGQLRRRLGVSPGQGPRAPPTSAAPLWGPRIAEAASPRPRALLPPRAERRPPRRASSPRS